MCDIDNISLAHVQNTVNCDNCVQYSTGKYNKGTVKQYKAHSCTLDRHGAAHKATGGEEEVRNVYMCYTNHSGGGGEKGK